LAKRDALLLGFTRSDVGVELGDVTVKKENTAVEALGLVTFAG